MPRTGNPSQSYTVKPLNGKTWPDFSRLVDDNNGVWGGCWCMWYHGKDAVSEDTPEAKREAKKCRVREGKAHAALVYEGSKCIGWCQFGSPDEIPRIHNQRAYNRANTKEPDWRITCFFSGKGHRGSGVAGAALEGAIAQIKKLGGGRIEAYPEDTEGRKASAAFLFNGALSMFEACGFKRTARIGKHRWVVTRIVR